MNIFTIRKKQEECVDSILNLHMNNIEDEIPNYVSKWKILIYDEYCKDIILPLVNVKSLRNHGITLHLLINKPRDKVDDVIAIYFVQPTVENINYIAEDCKLKLYDTIYLNFSTSLPRPLLEDLAKQTVLSNTCSTINGIYDCFTNYISFDEYIYTFNLPRSFSIYMKPSSEQRDVYNYSNTICQGLLSVFATLETTPIIVGPKSENCANIVTTQFDQLLREYITAYPDLLSNSTQPRPLLVLLDRMEDLILPLYHNSTYISLVYDLLPSHNHRIFTPKETFFLDTKEDKFWSKSWCLPFPEAIEYHKTVLDKITNKEKKIRNGKSTENLVEAMESLPELFEEKKHLEIHTKLFEITMDEITKRDTPIFVEMEEGILNGTVNLQQIKVMLSNTKYIDEDKLRVSLVYMFYPQTSVDECKQIISLLPPDLQPTAKFVLELKCLQSSKDPQNDASNFWTKATGLLNKAKQHVQHYLPTLNRYYCSQLVESLMNRKSTAITEDYIYFDPKVKNIKGVPQYMMDNKFDHIIVFVIGGGSLNEYLNMKNLFKDVKTKISYGSTQLFTPKEFLEELKEISQNK